MKTSLIVSIAAVCLLRCAAGAAEAQTPAGRVDESNVHALRLEPSNEIANGTIAMVAGDIGAEPDRFLVEGLTILQPVQVAVIARNPEADIRVRISKVLWDQPEREGGTRGEGAVRFAFRTEGDFRIQVSAPAGRQEYQLVVWAGDASPPPIRPAFVPMATYLAQRGGGSGGGGAPGSPVMWVIAGALVVIAGLLAVVVLRKGTGARFVLLFVPLLAATLAAGPLPVTTTNDVWPTNNAISDMKKDIAKYKEYKDYKDSSDKAGKAAGSVQKATDSAKGMIDLFGGYKGLSDGDAASDPNFNPPGSPQVPTNCDERDTGACSSCYEDAYARLNRVRANLERLRAVRVSTEEFYRASTSFGDNVAGVHGVAGLAWQAERRKIEQSFAGFKKAYANKHAQLIATLREALDAIAVCEAKHFDNPDWYNRFGFMYHSFMESRYAW